MALAAPAYAGTVNLNAGGATSAPSVSSVPIGTAAANRLVVVAVHIFDGNTAGRTVTAATIGGIAATIGPQQAGSTATVVLISAMVPTGTTATVALTLSGSITLGGNTSIQCSGWAIYGANSATAFSSNGAIAASGAIAFGPATSPSGGVIICAVTMWDNSGTSAFTGFKTTRDYNPSMPGAATLTAEGLSDVSTGAAMTVGHTGATGGTSRCAGVSGTWDPAPSITYPQLERGTRGLMRGVTPGAMH